MLNWVEIDARAIHWNVTQFRRRLGPDVLLGAVVKSNAYGHGMLEVAALACEAGADWLCVNNVEEAVRLRKAGHRSEILVMGYIPGDQLGAVVEHHLRPVVYNLETVDRLDRLASVDDPVGVHLKVETGTHRQGIGEAEVVPFAQRVQRSPRLTLEGISTHFANIEDSTDHAFAQVQMATFARISDALGSTGMPVLLRHAACSAATLLFTRTHLDLVPDPRRGSLMACANYDEIHVSYEN